LETLSGESTERWKRDGESTERWKTLSTERLSVLRRRNLPGARIMKRMVERDMIEAA
jgi:hypothetical protein